MWARRLRVTLIRRTIELPLYKHLGGMVVQGPFHGMRYIPESFGSALGPKLLGTYEKELAPWIMEIIGGDVYDVAINIGAAEGYYAVGLLTRMPDLCVLAYETSAKARGMLAQMGEINNVLDRLEIERTCSSSELNRVLGKYSRAVVVCDIEGGEKGLLDPNVVRYLCEADILVELHDFMDRGISQTIYNRFKDTHKIETVSSRARTWEDVQAVKGINAFSRMYGANERRPEKMSWYWMKSRVPGP